MLSRIKCCRNLSAMQPARRDNGNSIDIRLRQHFIEICIDIRDTKLLLCIVQFCRHNGAGGCQLRIWNFKRNVARMSLAETPETCNADFYFLQCNHSYLRSITL